MPESGALSASSRPITPHRCFQYEPLVDAKSCKLSIEEGVWSIRLIDLQPGDSNASIECRLHHSTLGAALNRYEALSYVWGHPDKCKTILVNDFPMEVTQSLYDSLHRLRYLKSPRRIWIDAICINQDDLLEKAVQVERMWAVYNLARRVLVDLGGETMFSKSGMDMIVAIAEKSSDHKALVDFLCCSKQDSRFTSAYLGLRDLFAKPWWSRMWIVQEVAVAQEALVICGNRSVPWKAFEEAVLVLCGLCLNNQDSARQDSQFQAHLDSLWSSLSLAPAWSIVATRKRFECRDFISLASLMICFRSAGTSDPRDYLYSLLRLSPDASHIIPDYQKSPKEVFKEVTRLCINDHSGLAIFSGLDHTNNRLLLPSWCPDWTAASPANLPFYSSHFCCAGDILARPIFANDTLTLRGARLDRVRRVSTAMPMESRMTLDTAFILADHLWSEDVGDRVNFARRTIAFLKNAATLFSDSLVPTRKGSKSPVPSHIYGTWRMRRTLEDKQSMTSSYAKAQDIAAVVDIARGRSIILTENGDLGLAPASVTTGDIIVALYGGCTPFCLRSIVRQTSLAEIKPEGQKKHLILGDCYVEKWMYGAAVKMVDQGLLQEQDFVLQ